MSLNKWLGVGAGVLLGTAGLAVFFQQTFSFDDKPEKRLPHAAALLGISGVVLGTGLALGGKEADTFGRGMMYSSAAIPALLGAAVVSNVSKGKDALATFGSDRPCPAILAALKL